MTAILDRVGDALTARPATVFFDAMRAADDHIREHERAVWEATFAPPITRFSSCVCGRVMEKRGTDQIVVTDDEKLAAAEAVADCMGRPIDDFAPLVVTHVLHAINSERAEADYAADRDWDDEHALCGDDQ